MTSDNVKLALKIAANNEAILEDHKNAIAHYQSEIEELEATVSRLKGENSDLHHKIWNMENGIK